MEKITSIEDLVKLGVQFIELDGKRIYLSKSAELAAHIEIEKDAQA